METFNEDVELDARMVKAAMANGMDGIMSFAFRNMDRFPNPNLAVQRAEAFKEYCKTNQDYLNKVVDKVQEL